MRSSIRLSNAAGGYPKAWAAPDSLAPAQVLFSDAVVIHPDRQRIVIRAPVASLNAFLLTLERRGYAIEHIYDF